MERLVALSGQGTLIVMLIAMVVAGFTLSSKLIARIWRGREHNHRQSGIR